MGGGGGVVLRTRGDLQEVRGVCGRGDVLRARCVSVVGVGD